MDLSHLIKHLIYDNHNPNVPEHYVRFGIMSREHTAYEREVKPYPLTDKERIFALLWNTHDENKLSATMLPADRPFCYESTFQVGCRTQMHSHAYLELFYVAEGEYKQKILGTEYTFHKGEMCLMDQNCLHQEIRGKDSSILIFIGITKAMFNDVAKRRISEEKLASFLNMTLLEQKTLQQYLHFKPLDSRECCMEETLCQLLSELEKHDAASEIICQGLLTRIIHDLCTKYQFSLTRQQKKKMNVLLFEEITEYMEKELQNITIQKLVEEFHFQEDYFNRLLKKQTGLTYTEYLQMLRLQKAEELLENQEESIDDIVKKVGYRNKGYFYKIFMNKYQMTPAQYRREL